MSHFYQDEPDSYDDHDQDDFDPCAPVFANPGSALRAATDDNPREHPCPNCGAPDRLTPADVELGYQCDACADQAERGDGP